MGEHESITRAAGVVGGATLVSRILGFVRDVVVAYFFGSGMAADAFFVAFRIPNLLRRLLAEGALSVAFIPVFSEYVTQRSKDEALDMARTVFTALALVLLCITLLGELFAPLLVQVMAPGFVDDPEKFRLTVWLTRLTFPYIFFIGLVAVCMGVLNSLRHFAAPALAPALLNVFMILCVYVWSLVFHRPIAGLAVGALMGGMAQLALQVPFMISRGFSFRPSFAFRRPAIRRILVLMGPAAMGAAVYQLNVVVGTLLASMLPQGSVSALYYADRLVEFPLGVFGIALGTATLPSMSRYWARNDVHGMVHAFSHAMKLIMFITLPASVGLIVLRHPIVQLLFQRGAFGAESTRMTAVALFYYTLGLWAFSSVRILANMFYALQDTKTPVKVAVLSFVVNVLFSVALMGPLKHGGLALATSLAAAVNVLVLLHLLRKRMGRLEGRSILASFLRTAASATVMAGVLYGLAAFSTPGTPLVRLAVSLVLGTFAYFVAARLFGCEELNHFTALLRRRQKASA